MNNIRIVALTLFRTYVTRHTGRPVAGVRGKLRTSNADNSNFDAEEFDEDDLDQFESDFMQVDQSHVDHQSEMRRHRLKTETLIAARKDFNDVEPSFLTFIEKDQIRKLHETDPEYWTVEKLSDSFPALPGTIRKILKSKWVPDSIERAVKYDRQVAENWQKFRNGDLPLSSNLTEHLMKFKGRKIVLADREELAAYVVAPEDDLPKPKSQVFRNILHASLESRGYDIKSLSSEDNSSRLLRRNRSSSNEPAEWFKDIEFDDADKPLTYREFTRDKLLEYYETYPERAVTLLYSYKKYLEAYNLRHKKSNLRNHSDENNAVEVNEENGAVLTESTQDETSDSEKERSTDTTLMEKNDVAKNGNSRDFAEPQVICR